MYGLPGSPDNLAEGLVLKPDARLPVPKRPVYKRKQPAFDEARFRAAERWRPGVLDLEALRSWLPRLVTPARLASARSKVGEDRCAIVEEVGIDVALDLADLFEESWSRLTASQQASLVKGARDLADRVARDR